MAQANRLTTVLGAMPNSLAISLAVRGLNTLADAGQFDRITRRINGGQNGAADRQTLYARALKVLA